MVAAACCFVPSGEHAGESRINIICSKGTRCCAAWSSMSYAYKISDVGRLNSFSL